MSNKIVDITGLERFFENVKTYISGLLNAKQDLITDLDDIREGASLGVSSSNILSNKVDKDDLSGYVTLEYFNEQIGILRTLIENITTIGFTLDGQEYRAEKDMTWEDWVNSKYNTCGAIIDSGDASLAVWIGDMIVTERIEESINPGQNYNTYTPTFPR